MKSKKLITLIVSGLILLATATTAFAVSNEAGIRTEKPCQILSELTGNSVEEIRNEHFTENKTFSEIAEENNVLDDYESKVPAGLGCGNGNCDGTGKGYGAQNKNRGNNGYGNGRNAGNQNGTGQGQRLRDGSCIANPQQ